MATKSENGYLKVVMRYKVIAPGNVLVSKHKWHENACKSRDAYNREHPNQPAMVVKI